MQLEAGGTHTGDFSIAAGSTLWLDGTHSFAATSDITGAGTVNVVGGTTTFNGQLSASGTLRSSAAGRRTSTARPPAAAWLCRRGTLGGTGNVTFAGASTWTGGTMSGSGQTTIGSGGTLSISAGSTVFLERLLVNKGTTTWTAGDLADDRWHVHQQRQLHGQ